MNGTKLAVMELIFIVLFFHEGQKGQEGVGNEELEDRPEGKLLFLSKKISNMFNYFRFFFLYFPA